MCATLFKRCMQCLLVIKSLLPWWCWKLLPSFSRGQARVRGGATIGLWWTFFLSSSFCLLALDFGSTLPKTKCVLFLLVDICFAFNAFWSWYLFQFHPSTFYFMWFLYLIWSLFFWLLFFIIFLIFFLVLSLNIVFHLIFFYSIWSSFFWLLFF